MIDHFSIFNRQGVVLWSEDLAEGGVEGAPVQDLVRHVLLEERAVSAHEVGPYALKWTLANELDLVFVVVFNKIIGSTLGYLDGLLQAVKTVCGAGVLVCQARAVHCRLRHPTHRHSSKLTGTTLLLPVEGRLSVPRSMRCGRQQRAAPLARWHRRLPPLPAPAAETGTALQRRPAALRPPQPQPQRRL